MVGEAVLLERLQRGDAAAYEALVRDEGPRMLAVARRFLRDEDDARDAVQEAFISAFRSIDRFEGGSRLGTWLHRIVVNAALMKIRSRRRKPEESIDDLLPGFLEDGHMADPARKWPISADQVVEREELRSRVRGAIDRLPETHRSILLLRDIEGFDTEEAAQMLGISKNAVKVRLHRARQALREMIDPDMREALP